MKYGREMVSWSPKGGKGLRRAASRDVADILRQGVPSVLPCSHGVETGARKTIMAKSRAAGPPLRRVRRGTLGLLTVVLLALACLLAGTRAANAQIRHSAPDGSFSIALPGDWVAIPPLELYLFEHQGQSGPVPPEALAEFRATRMGFQRKAEKWFSLPYMIITLEKGKQRTPRDLFMESVMAEKDSEAGSGGEEGYRFLEKDHLPARRVTYYKDVSYSPAQGRNVAMGVYTYLTSRGFLRVAWFAAEDELTATENMLHRAAMSVTLAPGMEYKPEGKK